MSRNYTSVSPWQVQCEIRPSDETIAGNLQNKIAADPATKDSAIEALVKDGKVTLRGTARTMAAQQKAEEFARLELGVVVIEDAALVEEEAASAPAPPAPAEKVRARRTTPATRGKAEASALSWCRLAQF